MEMCPASVLLGLEEAWRQSAGASGNPAKARREGFYTALILLLLLELWFSSL